MARKPRVVIAGQPLHVIQRGNDRQAVFYADEDYQRYLDDLDTASKQHGHVNQGVRVLDPRKE